MAVSAYLCWGRNLIITGYIPQLRTRLEQRKSLIEAKAAEEEAVSALHWGRNLVITCYIAQLHTRLKQQESAFERRYKALEQEVRIATHLHRCV